ncbi:DNA helicase-2 / ATP-dependent DNA helicase PcrA [Quadrisphaera granulorum]|uniref:DNA 3'-5' helicase n=1 Tax=Quadrisphaera granulorum TaxID=317664 RepID=A0A316AF47_9ACTN|nr:DNA helicase-2/ATP-dependent DNA helicase PcrA [Quadrisphaera granulorum]SZE94855.1 DNA helicase-2 / ATP-dependent DNA helicase PcrA [Quadrisphaera granulorum]
MTAHSAPQRLSAADIASALGQHPPTPEQAAVIEAPLSPLLVVAGAGSGKTETMAARVVWLVANGHVEPERVLGLTFTRKAAGELAERVRLRLAALDKAGLLPAPAGVEGAAGTGRAKGSVSDASPTVATYHAYAAGLVTDHGLRIGVEPRSQLIGPAAAWQLAADIVDTAEAADADGADGLGDLDAAPSTLVTAVLGLAGECAEHLVDVDAVDATLAGVVARVSALPGKQPVKVATALDVLRKRRRVLPLLRRYAERKRELGVLDHGDQVRLAARIAAEVPAVAALERARWGVVLLDEYQDTSTAQAELLSRLFGGGHPVTAVGDPHQAIYGWRGASAGGLQAFPTRFRRADGAAATHLALSTSWRNDVAVLDAAAVVAQPLRAASRLPLPVLGPRPGAGQGRVEVAWAQTAGEEAALLADRIAVIWHADARRPPDELRTAAVLCRARSQFPLIEEALRARDVPVEVVGLGGLLLRPEVVDVVSALRALADPTRGDALIRLLTGPRWRLGPRDLAVLAAWARRRATSRRSRAEQPADGRTGQPAQPEVAEEASLVDAVDDPPPADWETADGSRLSDAARERVREAGLLLRRLRELDLPLADLVVAVERALLLDVELAARASTNGSSPAAARAGLDALAEVAASFTAATGAGTSHRASLRAFLAWLSLAEEHEHGLDQASSADAEDPTPGLSDGGDEGAEPSRTAVQLLTVHASKGLEWDVVAVAGLAERGFPTAPRTSQGWLSGLGVLPHPLRGDADSLPHLAWETALDAKGAEAERAAYAERCAQAHRAEERRLAYVALTRARSLLLLTGAWWGGERKKERVPSAFLVEVVEHLRASGSGDVPELPEAPEEAENPELREPRRATWPFDPLGPRRPALEAAAAAVREAAEHPAPDAGPWAEEVEALLSERARGDAGGTPDVELPAHLSASRLVQLAADPAALALAVRRPVPVQPRVATRRGVAFHAWLEERFRSAALLDLDEVLGPDGEEDDDGALHHVGVADAPGDGLGPLGADEEELAALQASFLASEWAQREPIAVEVDLETPVAGLVVRCRVDAVFTRPASEGGGVDVVDWKTGRPPTGEAARAAAVQLAVYRLAWSRWKGVPLEQVGAAFFYAATGTTSRPADLLDAEGLEMLVRDSVSPFGDPNPQV